MIHTVLTYMQLAFGVLLIIGVLLQQNDAGLGAAFGGGDDGAISHTRRGIERIIFYATIVSASLFVLVSILVLIL